MKRWMFIGLMAYGMTAPVAWASPPGLAPIDNAGGDIDLQPGQIDDSWENVNRPLFDFNLCVDRNIGKPVASAYHKLPVFVKHSVSNVLTNLTEPLNTIHGVLQLNPKVAFTSFWRFVLNSTLGLAGIRDFAGEQGLHNMDQNLGKTLGHWGLPAGPYVMLPVLGPSSVRDTTGKVGDWFLNPTSYYFTFWESASQYTVDSINTRDAHAAAIDYIFYQSIDPYVALRSAYRQHEAYESKQDNR